MIVTINLFPVTKKTSRTDALILLNNIYIVSNSFYRIDARKQFIVGCLNACGFEFCDNFGPVFPRVVDISADCSVFRLPYSCAIGRRHSVRCFDVDISSFK